MHTTAMDRMKDCMENMQDSLNLCTRIQQFKELRAEVQALPTREEHEVVVYEME